MIHLNFTVSELNVWAILIGTIITMAIGALWYSPVLFGKIWAKLVGLNSQNRNSSAGPMIGAMLMNLIATVLLAIFIQLTGAANAGEGLLIALLLALAIAAKIAMNYFFEGKKLNLFLITAGYHTITLLISGLLLGAWH